jgi:hypothetical protein
MNERGEEIVESTGWEARKKFVIKELGGVVK